MALALATPAVSHAQPATDEAELARLRSIFSDGIRLEEQSRWADALAAFEEVAKAKRTAAVVFHLGLCHEKLGRLKKAKVTFEEAEKLATSEGAQAGDVGEKAARRRDAIAERMPTLRVTMKPIPDAKVSVNNAAWTDAEIGNDVPIDPGKARVVVDKGGQVLFEREVTLREGDHKTVRVELGGDDDAPPGHGPPGDAPPPPTDAGAEPGNKIPAIVVGSVGLGALVSGAVLFGLGQAAIGEVKETCNAELARCDPEKQAVAEQGEVYHYASIGLAAGGVVLLGTATVLWFTVGADKAKAQAQRRVSLSLWPGGVTVRGSL